MSIQPEKTADILKRTPFLQLLPAFHAEIPTIPVPMLIKLDEKDYKAIANGIQYKVEPIRNYEQGQYFNTGEIKIMLRGHETVLRYTYYAEGEIYEDRHGYSDYGEKIDTVCLEDVTADLEIICDGEFATDFDEIRLRKYFLTKKSKQ